jgi:hypothetical protein
VRVARLVAQAIGWVFVAVIAYHGFLAAIDTAHAVDDRNWSYAVELGTIAIVAMLVVGAAVVAALRSFTRTR